MEPSTARKICRAVRDQSVGSALPGLPTAGLSLFVSGSPLTSSDHSCSHFGNTPLFPVWQLVCHLLITVEQSCRGGFYLNNV